MAYERLSPTALMAAIQSKIEEKTGIRCYDYVALNTPSPFYFAELVRSTPANSKTMFRDVFTVNIHCIAAPPEGDVISSAGVYELIDSLEEALTEDIELPEPFELIMQTNNGIQNIKTDETREKHATLSYDFMVCYGFMCKI